MMFEEVIKLAGPSPLHSGQTAALQLAISARKGTQRLGLSGVVSSVTIRAYRSLPILFWGLLLFQ